MGKIIRSQVRHYSKNLKNFRNVCKDTDDNIITHKDHEYNCMGYALGTYVWEELKDFEEWAWWHEDEDEETFIVDMLCICIDEILARFSNLREIKYISDALPTERVIAMRIGADDFHFARLGSDGIWTHKPGNQAIQEMTEDELFDNMWCEHRCHPYTSDIIFFAIKERN